STLTGRFRSALGAAVLGGAIGLTAGAVEGAVTLYFSPLEFRAPFAELVIVEAAYGLACALFAGVLVLLFRAQSPRRAAAWTLGTLCLFVFLPWAKHLA